MREILFRAKTSNKIWGGNTIKENTWVYGYYRDKVGLPVISQFETERCGYIDYEIDENTIGQYTGLTDKNGKKIFEGDIVKLVEPKLKIEWNAIVEFGNPNGVYDWGYQLKPITNNAIKYEYNLDILCWVGMEDVNVYCEVIGNIYDNPELVYV